MGEIQVGKETNDVFGSDLTQDLNKPESAELRTLACFRPTRMVKVAERQSWSDFLS